MYRVFLSYSTTAEQMVVVWRLQTLAAASGLHLDVPSKSQRLDWPTVRKMIDDCDAVIVLLTKRAANSRFVRGEVEYAVELGKRVIPILETGVVAGPLKALLHQRGMQAFDLDPRAPWKMEADLSEHLQREVREKSARNAILALAGTLAGLFLLGKLTEA
jgi:hypothetical protein